MFTYTFDFGNDYISDEYTMEVDDYDVVEALLEIFNEGDLYSTIKTILENIDFDAYLDNNNDVPCTIDEYLKEVWDGTYKGFVKRFDIKFIADQLHDCLYEYFEKIAANEYENN